MDFRDHDYFDNNRYIYSDYSGNNDFILSVQVYTPKTGNRAFVHYHDEYQFTLPVADIEAFLHVDRYITAKTNVLYYIPSNAEHGFTKDLKKIVFTRFIITKRFWEEVALKYVPGVKLDVPVEFPISYELKELMNLFKMECRKGEKNNESVINLYATMLCVQLMKDCRRVQTCSNDKKVKLNIDNVGEYIFAHCEKNITLDFLAEALGITKYHFIRIFCKKMGETPHSYLIKARLSRAKTLLEGNQYSVSEISDLLSFSTPHYFSKAFKKNTGLSPQQYRKLSRQMT
jgi:YesN/AraC family two-component response regulator